MWDRLVGGFHTAQRQTSKHILISSHRRVGGGGRIWWVAIPEGGRGVAIPGIPTGILSCLSVCVCVGICVYLGVGQCEGTIRCTCR